jgi:hypothetical protein
LKHLQVRKHLGDKRLVIWDNTNTDIIKKGNRAHFTYKSLMTSKLIGKETKKILYMALKTPVVTYGCET